MGSRARSRSRRATAQFGIGDNELQRVWAARQVWHGSWGVHHRLHGCRHFDVLPRCRKVQHEFRLGDRVYRFGERAVGKWWWQFTGSLVRLFTGSLVVTHSSFFFTLLFLLFFFLLFSSYSFLPYHHSQCPMLGGYDTIVEVADHAPEESVGGPITTLVPPSSCRQATTDMNNRLPHTCIIFNDSAEPLDYFMESNYPGHRRNEPPRHPKRGFARYSMQRLLVPNPVVVETSFGVTERAAVANAPGCWPRRHTWHSEEVANGNLSRVRRQSDYSYVSARKFASGSNDPNIYVAHMDTYKVGQLEMRKLSWFLRDERNRIANAKKEEEDSAMQARIEAGKAMAAQRESDRIGKWVEG